jgi:hypothetical protein
LVVRFDGEEETVSIGRTWCGSRRSAPRNIIKWLRDPLAGGRIMTTRSDPPVRTGDPWIDAYRTFRRAWLDGASEDELADLATECRRGLPSRAPPAPAAMFIYRDILITCGQKALPPQLFTALRVPDSACLH